MSLINQMLRDLERREPTMQTASPPLTPDPAPPLDAAMAAQEAMSWPMPADEADPTRKWLLAGLGLSAVMVISGGAWWIGRESAPHRPVPLAQPLAELPRIPAPPVIPDIEPDPKAEVPELPETNPVVEPPPAQPVSPARTAAAKPVIKAVAVPIKPVAAPKAAAPLAPVVQPPSKPATVAPTQPTAVPRAEQLFLQAQTELKQGQADAALVSLRAALEADPKHVQARLNLARLLAERKQLPAAADLLADGVMLLPQQNAFVLALAPLWFQSGQQDDALALLAQSAKQPTATPQLTSYYASQLLRLKRHAEAAMQFRAALRSDPLQPDWLIGLGLSLQGASQNKEAIEAFRRAYETGKLSPERKDLVEQMIAGLKSRS